MLVKVAVKYNSLNGDLEFGLPYQLRRKVSRNTQHAKSFVVSIVESGMNIETNRDCVSHVLFGGEHKVYAVSRCCPETEGVVWNWVVVLLQGWRFT